MKLSFGMIFSIILIIIFLIFSFYVITKILDFQKSGQIGLFVNDFQEDVNKVWQSSKASQVSEYSLPKEIEQVCIDEVSRIVFRPLGTGGNLDYTEIEHITPKEICFNNNGKVKIIIKKDYGETLVSLENEQ